ncbi:N-6 DNA methylase [Nonomuraea rhizosphaerae]|uniref:N-6 DNA methylase n=1 Tax=Nonomuraea rhizosphaerae TaxID=2665663 RepID=UPI001C5E73CA|nr:N-6 DNA methylase [Nonomuraea rhizosphaerae]
MQSDLHMLLAAAPFELDDDDIKDIVLEAPVGQRRRIDVEMGYTVFEVKRDLRVGNVRSEAIAQLSGYVRARTETLQQRYVGVLTDGAEWHLYHLVNNGLQPVWSLELNESSPDVDQLIVWLESVLATASHITPTPVEIERRLGAGSPSHKLDFLELQNLYRANRNHSEVQLKRELWSKLLTTALGTNFTNEDDLFVEHTLLVATAEIIAHAVVGIDPADPTVAARTLLEGSLFASSQVGGVVEADFFDWIVDIPGGDRFVKTLSQRLARFAWQAVEHDVMKVLYESIIASETRHALGEYYTPDWLAEEVVKSTIHKPLDESVLDPACGSGTFLFHAVRRYLQAAEEAGVSDAEAITGVTRHVMGVDVHPVAVTLARVTYLLALGMDRLQSADRPPFSVPVYLGDSMQWGQEDTLLNTEGLTVPTNDGAQLFADELKFPDRLLADAASFDRLVTELAQKATRRAKGSPVPSLSGIFRLFAVHPHDQPMLEQTFATMCRLNDEDRNHIWGYYVRNLARPIWLSQKRNRVDVLIGNPPWLAYRFMPDGTKSLFRRMSEDRGMWAGASVATHQDLSGLFLVRAAELYLSNGGRFGLVMPLAALSRRQFAGMRTGRYITPGHQLFLSFDTPWDLHKVKPVFFPVPASVLFGTRTADTYVPLAQPAEIWAGRLPSTNVSSSIAMQHLSRMAPEAATEAATSVSPYAARFVQGAAVGPRVFFVVEESPSKGALGPGAGRIAVQSRRSTRETPPWNQEPSMASIIERQFVRSLLVGDSVLPYAVRDAQLAVIPWDGQRLLGSHDDRLDDYPGLAEWWREAEKRWRARKGSRAIPLHESLDYRHKITQQFPVPQHRIVHSKSGMYMAAARVSDASAIVQDVLYWGAAASVEEAQYVIAVLNSQSFLDRVRPLQARGQHNPRHFDKYIWQVPVPLFDPQDESHRRLATLSAEAEEFVASLELPGGVSFEAVRGKVRDQLQTTSFGREVERLVDLILTTE